MNKTENELLELGRKVSHNYKLIVMTIGFVCGCFAFYNQQNQNTRDISDIRIEISELKKRTSANERKIDVDLADIKRQLAGISTDVQEVKRILFTKGLEHDTRK